MSKQKVYVLTHTNEKNKTRVIGVYSTSTSVARALTDVSTQRNLNPLELFITPAEIDEALDL